MTTVSATVKSSYPDWTCVASFQYDLGSDDECGAIDDCITYTYTHVTNGRVVTKKGARFYEQKKGMTYCSDGSVIFDGGRAYYKNNILTIKSGKKQVKIPMFLDVPEIDCFMANGADDFIDSLPLLSLE